MCGIIAQWSWGAPLHRLPLQAALQTLKARGPDQQGLWLNASQQVALGQTRLAIRGLSNGSQPLHSNDGQLHAVVNGEFYGEQALRQSLAAQGYRFQTESDSELVLALYQRDGLDFVHALRGEFALIIWDGQRLIAARDRLGVKPLVYAQDAQGLRLASKARALFASGWAADWDLAGLLQSFALQYLLPGQSLFSGVKQLPPGHLLIAEAGQVQLKRYWDLEDPLLADLRPWRASDSTALQTNLQESIRLRLAADVPLCTHLSGGLDSASILAGVCAERPQTPCFSVSFPESPAYNELAAATEIAAYLDSPFHEVPVSSAQIAAAYAETVYHSEGLMINGHAVAKALLNREIQQAGFKVALTGEGADELLFGYTHFRGDLGWSEHDPRVAGIHQVGVESLDLSRLLASWGHVPQFLQAKASLGKRLQHFLISDQLQDYDPVAALAAAFDSRQLAGRHILHQSNRLWRDLALAQYILPTVGDGAEMMYSIEGRPPFLDHHLFESLQGVDPVSFFSETGLEKMPLRQAMHGRLPTAVLQRAKHPFTAPPLGLFAGWRQFVERQLLSLPLPPLVSRSALQAFFKRWPDLSLAEQIAWDPPLQMILSATLLQDQLRLGHRDV